MRVFNRARTNICISAEQQRNVRVRELTSNAHGIRYDALRTIAPRIANCQIPSLDPRSVELPKMLKESLLRISLPNN